MATSVGPDGIDVSGYGWTNQSTSFNSNLTLQSQAGPVTTVLTPGLVSGTAKVISAQFDTMVYFNVTTSATTAIAIGPTSAAANVILASGTVVAPTTLSVLVPAGWFLKATFATTTIVAITTKL